MANYRPVPCPHRPFIRTDSVMIVHYNCGRSVRKNIAVSEWMMAFVMEETSPEHVTYFKFDIEYVSSVQVPMISVVLALNDL